MRTSDTTADRHSRRLTDPQHATLAFAARHGIERAFAYDADLAVAGLAPVTPGS